MKASRTPKIWPFTWTAVPCILFAFGPAACGSNSDPQDARAAQLETPPECTAALDDLRRCFERTSPDPARVQVRFDAARARLNGAPPRTEAEREAMQKQCIAMTADLKKQCL
jgi:hypothetical protein